MPARPAPDLKVPPKVQALLENPVLCAKIASCFDAVREVGLTVLMELPLFCKANGLDASATVLAMNSFLTHLEVIRDKGVENQRKEKVKVV